MRHLITTALATAALFGATVGHATVIDFDAGNPTYFGLTEWQEDSMTLASNAADGTLVDNNNLVRANIGAPGVGNNTQSIFWGANGQADNTLTLTHDLGYGFALESFDASSLYNASGSLTITGYQAAGGTVSQVIALTSNLTQINVTGMTGLSTLQFSFDGSSDFAPYDLDNISLSLVPVPAAVWLMGSALSMLIAVRRRKS